MKMIKSFSGHNKIKDFVCRKFQKFSRVFFRLLCESPKTHEPSSAPICWVSAQTAFEKKRGFCSEQNQAVLVELFDRAMKWSVSKRLSAINLRSEAEPC